MKRVREKGGNVKEKGKVRLYGDFNRSDVLACHVSNRLKFPHRGEVVSVRDKRVIVGLPWHQWSSF